METEEIDLQRVCRTCLEKEEDMSNMFIEVEYENGKTFINNMLEYCTQLELIEGDGLPMRICYKCLNCVKNFFSFKVLAKKSDTKLRNYILNLNPQPRTSVVQSIKVENDSFEEPYSSMVKAEIESFSDEFGIDDNTRDSDDSDDYKPLINLKEINKTHSTSLRQNIIDRKTFFCKLCDKNFKYIKSLNKHLQKHLEQEDFTTHNSKSKVSFLEGRMELLNPDNNSDDYVIKSIIEDIKAKKFEKYIGVVGSNNTNDNIEAFKIDSIPKSKVKKSKLLAIKSKFKNGIKRVRRNKFHKCSLCERLFSRTNHLIKHMSKHSYNYPDKCEVCNRVFPNKEWLSRHNKELCAKTDKPFECGKCETKFADEFTFNTHMMQRHKNELLTPDFMQLEDIIAEKCNQYMEEINDIPVAEVMTKLYGCSGCDFKFIDSSIFKEHVLKYHNGEHEKYTLLNLNIKLEKPELDDNLQNTTNLDQIENDNKKKRIRSKQTKLHKCSLCERTFTRSNHALRHMSTHNYEYPDKCSICGKVFPNKEMLYKHSLIKCDNLPKLYKCGTCSMMYDNEASFNEHISTLHMNESVSVIFIDPMCQSKEKMYCEYCDKAFYRKDLLERHLKKGHKHQCTVCFRKFKEKDDLIFHSTVHNYKKGPDSKYHCVECDRTFTHTSNMVVHMRRHKGEKPYKCEYCNKGFPRSSDLRTHIRTHTGEKPCLCTVCGKSFSTSTKLVRHMRIHTGLRPYKCTHCNSTFTQSNDLTLHIRRHTGERPYICGVCGDCFISSTALHAHKRMHQHYDKDAN